jgi:hypothetical protein
VIEKESEEETSTNSYPMVLLKFVNVMEHHLGRLGGNSE